MGYRTMKVSDTTFTVRNTSSSRMVIPGANLPVGSSRTIAASSILNSPANLHSVASLMELGKISLALVNELGFVNFTLTATQLRAMTMPIAGLPNIAAAALPAGTDVPIGFAAFDPATGLISISDGTAVYVTK